MRLLLRGARARTSLLRALLAAGLAALVIAGCGGSGGDGGGGSGKGEVVITCGFCQPSPTDPFVQFTYEASQEFNKKFKGRYRIETIKNPYISSTGGERLPYYKRLALADDLPDIIGTNGTERAQLARMGKLFDYSKAFDEDPAWRDSFHESALDGVSGDDGEVWAIPQQRDVIGIYYNKRLFREAGVAEFPQTWDDFEATCEKLKAIGKACIAFDGDWTTLLMWANLIGTQEGGAEFLDSGLSTGKYAGNPIVVRATEQLKAWHDAGFVNKDSLTGKYDDAAAAYMSGAAAMVANGPWMVPLNFKAKGAPKGLYEETGYELSPGYTADGRGIVVSAGGSGYSSGAKSEATQAGVAEFLKFLTSRDKFVAFTIATGSYPSVRVKFTDAEAKKLEPLALGLSRAADTVPFEYKEVHQSAPGGFGIAWKNLWPAYVKADLSTDEFLKRLGTDTLSPTG